MMYGAQVAALVAGIGIAVAAAPAAADFDGHRMLGDLYYPNQDTLFDSFDKIIDPSVPEYVSTIDGHPFDGYYVNFEGSTMTLKVSVTDFERLRWNECNFGGFIFTDVDQTMDAFESLAIIDSQGDEIPWIDMDYGVLNEDQFYYNIGPISGDQFPMYNGDFFTLEMTFVPAPAGGLLLLGACIRRRRRN